EQGLTLLKDGQPISMETKGLRSNGSEFPLRVSAAIVQKGSPNCILTIEDITIEKERKSEEEAIAEERRRIAQEIHDGLAQDLAALRLQTRRWKSMVDRDPDKVKSELDWLHDLLGEKIREVRSVIFALRPVALDELGFWQALERFIHEFGEQNQLTIHLEVFGERQRLPASLEPLVFRIIQEVLHNVARHAQAHTVWIKLDFTSGIILSVRDDGIGFDPSTLSDLAREGHLGLLQMRERVEALGGTLEVSSQPGKGTFIIVKVAVRAQKEKD
ncbi:MAG: sensor histidine kinase, partial [Anaerolineales bacterium]